MGLPSSPRVAITGAGNGFGRALALELARRGGRLVLSDVNVAGCDETARQALAAGAASARSIRCDVTRLAEVEALAAACEDGVDLVINNAGVGSGGAVGEFSLDDWHWTLDVDLWGVIHGCHVFTPILRKQGRGHILNVASAAGLLCAPRMGAYNVAKAGVIALSETLAGEFQGTSLGVTVVCPTFFKTDIVANGRFADPKSRHMGEKMIARGTSAESVARAALAAVDRNALYCVPMADGRWFWRLKRLAPASFGWMSGMIAKRL